MRTMHWAVISLALLGGAPPKRADAQEIRFLSRQDYPVAGPRVDDIADFNGDGRNDVFTGAYTGGYARVFLGDVAGTFGTAIDTPTPLSFHATFQRVADINGDGKLDVVIVGTTSVSAYLVLLGNGDGSFRVLTAVEFPNVIFGEHTLADFDRDGRPDMVIPGDKSSGGGGGAGNYFFRGRGDGTFDAPVHLDRAGCNGAVAVDFNRDGRADLATACDDAVRIYRGNGDGTFQAHLVLNLPNTPYAIATGDLNGDGWPDLVVTAQQTDALWVLVNNGDGTFATQTFASGLGYGQYNIRIGDVNGDGKLDVLTLLGPFVRDIGVWFGNGDGSLQKPVSVVSASTDFGFAIGSLRRPGVVDLATAAAGCNCVSVHLNSGTGKYVDNIVVNLGLNVRKMQKYDFNHDGRTDLLVSSQEGLTLLTATGKAVAPFRITWKQALPYGSIATAVGDFNGDGLPDIATVDGNYQQELRLYVGNAAGGFQESYRVTPAVGSLGGGITTLDFNGDGKLDLASPLITVFPGRGDGTLAAPIPVPLGLNQQTRFVASTDLNGDGLGDLLTSYIHFTNGGLLTLPFQPGGIMPPSFTLLPNTGTIGINDGRLVDLNKDGILDLVAVGNGLFALLGKPGGGFDLSFQWVYNVVPAVGVPPSVEVGDFNGDGSVDIAVPTIGNSLLIFLGDSKGSFHYDSSWGGGGGGILQAAAGAFTDLYRPGYDELVTLNGDGTLTLLLNITRTNAESNVDLR